MGMVEKKSEMIGKIRQSWVIVGLLMARLTVNNCWYGFGKYWRIITLIRNLEKIRVCLLRFFAPFAYIFVLYCLLIFLFFIVETKILINKSNIKCFKKKKSFHFWKDRNPTRNTQRHNNAAKCKVKMLHKVK
jgi:hypothetical protein